MVIINDTGFGYVIVDGEKIEHDIVILPNGKIIKRRKDISAKYRNMYGHTPLSKDELKYYLNSIGQNIKFIVIGTGQYGDLPLTPEAKNFLEELKSRGTNVIIDKTPNIIGKLNELYSKGAKTLSIIHVTC